MKKYTLGLVLAVILFSHTALAAIQPIPNVDIILKRICNSSTSICDQRLAYTHTDDSGKFSASNLVNDVYEIYYSDESMPPIAKITPTNGTISGKISIEIYNQPATPTPIPVVKKDSSAPKIQTTVASTPKTTSSNDTFVYGVWDAEHLAKLQTVLVKENVLPVILTIKTIDDARAGIKLFQKKYGIDQTGTLGPTTIKKLNSLVNN